MRARRRDREREKRESLELTYRSKHPLFELEGHGEKRGAKKKRRKKEKRKKERKEREKRECKKRVRRVYITVHKRTRVQGWNRHGSN